MLTANLPVPFSANEAPITAPGPYPRPAPPLPPRYWFGLVKSHNRRAQPLELPLTSTQSSFLMTSPSSSANQAVEISFCEAFARASASHLARRPLCLSASSLCRASRVALFLLSLPIASRQSRVSSGTATEVSAHIGRSSACNA